MGSKTSMQTKQHNLKSVERTVSASGLLGRPEQRHGADRDYLDSSIWMLPGTTAGTPGLSGSFADIPGIANLA